jgi:hypothetical protein
MSLALISGCGRLGFAALDARSDAAVDSGHYEAADAGSIDAEVSSNGSTTSQDAALDSGPDAEPMDANVSDAGAADGGGSIDDGSIDDGSIDSGSIDSGSIDSGSIDSGSIDSGSVDSGSIDSGSIDSGSIDSGPASLCPEQPGTIFCDGFEDPTFSRWAFNVVSNGTLTQSTTRFRSGAGSLRATTGAASMGNAARYATDTLASQKAGDIWLRYYYYVPSSTVVTSHFSAGVISEIVPPYFGFALLVLPTRVEIGASGTFYQGTVTFPRDRWTCVELHVQIDPTAGIFEAYLDGTLAVRSSPTNTLPTDGYTSAEVGIHYADASQGPVEVYVDDVSVANTRLPCD